jgi:hypothetical protein
MLKHLLHDTCIEFKQKGEAIHTEILLLLLLLVASHRPATSCSSANNTDLTW